MTLFLPLDIPPIPNKENIVKNFIGEQFVSCYDVNNELGWLPSDNQNLDQSKIFSEWREEILIGDRLNPTNNTWSQSARTKYPELIAWYDEYFPFKKTYFLKLARSIKPVPPHIDIFENMEYEEFPIPNPPYELYFDENHLACGYRFLISGTKQSIYFCPEAWEDQTEKQYVNVPDQTDAFVLDAYYPHGVDQHPVHDATRIIALVVGELDQQKHHNLLEKSRQKYQNYEVTHENLCITKSNAWH